MIKECVYCKTAFQTGSNRAKYCSHDCLLAFNREHGKEKRQMIKAKKEYKKLAEKSQCLTNMAAEANSKGISYGTLAAKKQAEAVKIERKPLGVKKATKSKKTVKRPEVIYEYRKIQFDEIVQQYLLNEEVNYGPTKKEARY